MITANQKLVIDALSEEILKAAWSCAAEQHSPGHDADEMDRFIRERRTAVHKLRKIREELEDVFTGAILS